MEENKDLLRNEENREVKQEATKDEKEGEPKSRIEVLINEIEKVNQSVNKHLSYRSYFIKGLWQGLGIVIGSTIVAGVLYLALVKIIGKEQIDKLNLSHIIKEQEKMENK